MRTPAAIVLALVVLALQLACTDTTCNENRSSLPLMRFYNVDAVTRKATSASINVWVEGVGVPGDSMICNNTPCSEVYVPLRVTTRSTQYAMWRYHVSADGDSTLLRDTITFNYEPVPYYSSRECGAMYNFDMSTVTTTHHGIDSVALVQPVVTNELRESLRVYLTPQAD